MKKAISALAGESDGKVEELQALYYVLVEKIVQGEYEAVAEALRSFRESNEYADPLSQEREFIRRVLAIRLALKQGDPSEDASWLDLQHSSLPWLQAEKNFAKGYLYYRELDHERGIESFEEASRGFAALGMSGRSLLAAFNALVGKLEQREAISLEEQLKELRRLEAKVISKPEDQYCARVVALIHRQRAHAFEDQGKLHAALEEISSALGIFKVYGPQSDYQLGLLHAADIALDLGEEFRARTFFDYLVGPFDARIEFPRAYLQWRFGAEEPILASFTLVSPAWKNKFERVKAASAAKPTLSEAWVWNMNSSTLVSPDGKVQCNLKASGMEGRLLKLLMKERASKNFLIEAFWPESADSNLLDNRLHRMIFRLNKKLDMIHFDGKRYGLKFPIIAG